MIVPIAGDATSNAYRRQQKLKIALVVLATACAVGLVVLFAPASAVPSIAAVFFVVGLAALWSARRAI